MLKTAGTAAGRILTLVVLALVAALLSPTAAVSQEGSGAWLVTGVSTREQRSAVAATGAGIDEIRPDAVVVRATPSEREAIASLGFRLEPVVGAQDFPPADAAYHNYAETLADLDALAQAHPATVRRFSLGSSYEGRQLAGVRISDDATDNLAEPGVFFVGMHHAREHLTVEVVLSLAHLFAESTDPSVRALVSGRQIYIVPMLNPDGGEFDIATGSYVFWRKNRQPNAGTADIGTDLNRNYGYRWGCCGGSSGNPASETYRGPAPFSAPETDAVRRFVESRPNIRTAISYHSYGDQVLYPYGYTYTDVPPDMTPLDHQTFVAMAGQMAATTGYRAEQGSDLYITDGDFDDWMYGARGIFSFTFELSGSGYGFYPPASLIDEEVAKNRQAAIYAATMAECPVQAAGGSCASPPAVVSGSTFFVDGTSSRSGPATRISVFATGAEQGFTYQLVTGRDGGNAGRPCSTDVAVLNPAQKFANASGVIGMTSGVVNRPPGTWQVCFRSTGAGAAAVTAAVTYTVSSTG
jgi:carboxypeptidase T